MTVAVKYCCRQRWSGIATKDARARPGWACEDLNLGPLPYQILSEIGATLELPSQQARRIAPQSPPAPLVNHLIGHAAGTVGGFQDGFVTWSRTRLIAAAISVGRSWFIAWLV